MARIRNFGSQLADALKNAMKMPLPKQEPVPDNGRTVAGKAAPDLLRPDTRSAPSRNPVQVTMAGVGAQSPGNERSAQQPKAVVSIETPSRKPAPRVSQIGQFRRPWQFDGDARVARTLVCPSHDGIAGQISQNPDNETDLILGLDFGTSSVKAVIRDTVTERAYAVPFFETGENRYLLPSRVSHTGERYSLDRGTETVRDLKLRLLNCPANSPVTEFEDACAFLALVIRHCRGWLLDTYGPQYRDHQLYWKLNLGLAARSYEDNSQVLKFRRLAWAAANLAADQNRLEITRAGASEYRELSRDLFLGSDAAGLDDLFPFRMADTDVVPEIAAQFSGFSRSSSWDFRERPMMMLCDVGAGTVDCAFFSVTRQDDGLIGFSFFSDDVQPFGVMNLNRTRVEYLREVLGEAGFLSGEISGFLDEIGVATDQERPIPESLSEYHAGYRLDLPEGERDLDTRYYFDNYHAQVIRCLRQAKTEKSVPQTQLQGLPIFLCGGGSRMRYYSRIADSPAWAQLSADIRVMRLPVPDDLVANSLAESEFDRLSVAYGLAWQGDRNVEGSLGRIVRSMEIPPVERPPARHYTDLFTSKDQC